MSTEPLKMTRGSRVIRSEVVPAAEGKHVFVSTVDLTGPFENGHRLNPDLFRGPHGGHIETMVFFCDEHGHITDWGDIDAERSHFAAEAVTQHERMVAKWRAA